VTALNRACEPKGCRVKDLPGDVLMALYRKGLVYLEVPTTADDRWGRRAAPRASACTSALSRASWASPRLHGAPAGREEPCPDSRGSKCTSLWRWLSSSKQGARGAMHALGALPRGTSAGAGGSPSPLPAALGLQVLHPAAGGLCVQQDL
jgi:hypothetical protein